MEIIEEITKIINAELAEVNSGARVSLSLVGEPVVYADVKNGRSPRGLPIIGMHQLSRIADELDREGAQLVIVFDVAGKVNGVEYDKVTLWLDGRSVSLPTLTTFTPKARSLFWGLGDAVRVAAGIRPELLDAAWTKHLEKINARTQELIDYLMAVQRVAMGMESVR